MISDKQLEANRANAQHSTGPKTEAGKKRSSLNAIRHGLTGQVLVLPDEDLAAFNQLSEKTMAELQIMGEHETQIAKSYCMALWNVQKAMAIQESLLTLGIIEDVAGNLNIDDPQAHNAVSYAKTFRQDSEVFARISLYTQRLINQSNALRKQLEEVQAQRFKIARTELKEAVASYKFKQMMGETFNPAEFGFVLSLDQIRQYDSRNQLIGHPEIARHYNYNRPKYEQMAKTLAA
jgi:hypothetical protein